MGSLGNGAKTPGQKGSRETPIGRDSLLPSLLCAHWFKNFSESLTHWLLSDSGQVLCLAGLCFSPSSLSWGQQRGGVENWNEVKSLDRVSTD